MKREEIQRLIRIAEEQMSHAYAPYSHFQVGAALLTAGGKVYAGCNIENAAYTPSNCAERTAFFKAVSEGERKFSAICIVGGMNGIAVDYTAPCGVCRQVMMEFCDPKNFRSFLRTETVDVLQNTGRDTAVWIWTGKFERRGVKTRMTGKTGLPGWICTVIWMDP